MALELHDDLKKQGRSIQYFEKHSYFDKWVCHNIRWLWNKKLHKNSALHSRQNVDLSKSQKDFETIKNNIEKYFWDIFHCNVASKTIKQYVSTNSRSNNMETEVMKRKSSVDVDKN